MSKNDVLQGATTGFVMLTAYRNAVAEVIGPEQALDLHVKICDALGSAFGQKAKKDMMLEDVDAATARDIAAEVLGSMLGVSGEVVSQSPTKLVTKWGKCPVHEAHVQMGMTSEQMETTCRASSMKFMDSFIKQLNPKLRWESVRHRAGGEESCYDACIMEP